MTQPANTPETDRGEFRISRIFDAPRELVFKAWIEPDQVRRWFAPSGFSVPAFSVNIDPRPGGVFELVMVSDEDGTEYPNRGQFVELVEPERLVFIEPEIEMTTSITFVDLGDKTEIHVHQTNVPAEYRGPEAEAGWKSSLDNLAAHLAQRG